MKQVARGAPDRVPALTNYALTPVYCGFSMLDDTTIPLYGLARSDIQPRVEACIECVSFPHTNWVGYRLDDTGFMSSNSCREGRCLG